LSSKPEFYLYYFNVVRERNWKGIKGKHKYININKTQQNQVI